MKYLGILVLSSLAAEACASNNGPPAASAESVDEATSTASTGPGFAPASNDGLATAPADSTAHRAGSSPNVNSMTNANADAAHDPALDANTNNAAAMPAPSSVAPDNTRINRRDQGSNTLTPIDQGGSEADLKITQQIRQAVMRNSSLSFTAKNVKIITINGKVTLRGPVKSEAELASVVAAAKSVAGASQVDNFLEVAQ